MVIKNLYIRIYKKKRKLEILHFLGHGNCSALAKYIAAVINYRPPQSPKL